MIQYMDEIGILVDVVAPSIGAPTNPSKIANTFASECQMTYTNKTILNHIEYPTEAFLISKANRYDIKGRNHREIMRAGWKSAWSTFRKRKINMSHSEVLHIYKRIILGRKRL